MALIVFFHRLRKMKATELHRNTFLVVFSIQLSVFSLYSAISIKEKEAPSNWLWLLNQICCCDLQLISDSSVFGRNIHNLILIVRLFFRIEFMIYK